MKVLDKIIWHQDVPFHGFNMIAQWEVMRLASQNNIKVLLDGQGADEALGGYRSFAGILLIDQLRNFQFRRFLNNVNNLKSNRSINILMEVARAGYYLFPTPIQKFLRRKTRVGSGVIKKDYLDLINKQKVPPRFGTSFNQSCIQSIKYGLPNLLHYEDRNSMAFSIESRVPFLDHRFVEFMLSIPSHYKMKNGWSKHIHRKAIEKYLPQEVVWRTGKMGFITPQKKWFHHSKAMLHQYIENVECPDFIDASYIKELLNDIEDNTYHINELWRIIVFLKWLNIFKVKY